MTCGHTSKFFYHKCPDDPAAAGPSVHALVVGTSDYRPRGKAKPIFQDLAGTAVAAGRFAAWLVDGFHDPNLLPLRTVRVLLSPMPSENAYLPSSEGWDFATQQNVVQALEEWAEDCNSHQGNLAILYVGGHGTVTTDGAQHVFLSEANAYRDRYYSSINVTVIRELMRSCLARSNIYIFDCCALTEGQVPDITDAGGLRIAPFTDNPGPKREHQFTITAARVGTASHTIGAKEGTLLSWALLPLLKTAGELVGNYFAVTMEKLNERLLPTMQGWTEIKLPPGHEPVAKGEPDPAGFSRPQPPPSFFVALVADPEAAGHIVTVTISDKETGEAKMHCQVNGGDPVPFDLPAGRYKVVAEYRTDSRTREKEFPLDLDQSLRIFAFTGESAR